MKVRLPDTRYDDEIGRLCKTINQMAEDLAETERLKNEFISSVSHELRTPLTSIRGWVETISNIDDPTNENYRRASRSSAPRRTASIRWSRSCSTSPACRTASR